MQGVFSKWKVNIYASAPTVFARPGLLPKEKESSGRGGWGEVKGDKEASRRGQDKDRCAGGYQGQLVREQPAAGRPVYPLQGLEIHPSVQDNNPTHRVLVLRRKICEKKNTLQNLNDCTAPRHTASRSTPATHWPLP